MGTSHKSSESPTLPAIRRHEIEKWLNERQSIAVADIVTSFSVSEVTARHDLALLEKEGKLKRIRGGAVSLTHGFANDSADEFPYRSVEAQDNVEEKKRIARVAASFVDDGDVIIVDMGSTCMQFVHALKKKTGITIITGDLTIASYANLKLPHADVTLLGGALLKGKLLLAGSLALEGASKLYADKAFLSTNAFRPDRGFTVKYDFSISTKQTYIKNADYCYMMLDHSKFGKSDSRPFATLEDFDTVIVDEDPKDLMKHAIDQSSRKPQLIIAP